ncbi:uncharacterized protein [Cherax quadricarinatus]|nr:uncharacterized protein LOC128706456 [Cherax quadricarinatus]
MARGSQIEVSSAVLKSGQVSTPSLDDHEDAIVVFDTVVEYLPCKTRTRTALNAEAHVEDLKKPLFESKDHLVSEARPFGTQTSSILRHHEPMDIVHSYHMTVELESPESKSGLPQGSYIVPDQLDQESPIICMLRTFRCIKVDEDLPERDMRFLPLEVHRSQRLRQGSSRQHSLGYIPVSHEVTIDY